MSLIAWTCTEAELLINFSTRASVWYGSDKAAYKQKLQLFRF
jgi:hypothetical protein